MEKRLSKQDHIKLLQQKVVDIDGGMELLIDMRKRFQDRMDVLEERMSVKKFEWDALDRLELELLRIQVRFFDGKER